MLDVSVNNQAVVAYLKNITAIEGADKIVQADVVLNGIKITQIVTAVGTEENTLIVYFDSNLCLSDEVLKQYPKFGTYLAKGNRVRTIKLKGVISNGLAVNVSDFYLYESPHAFFEGYSFTHLCGIEVCKKYAPPLKVANIQHNPKKKGRKPPASRMVEGQFYFHVDTSQLLKNAHRINPDSVISISRKVHGTSAIAANCLVKTKKKGLGKLLFWKELPKQYDMVYASRSVIKNGVLGAPLTLKDGGYYGYDLWKEEGEKHFKGKLYQGESVYYEIVGFTPTGSCIQKGYDYGCAPNESKVYVYRITKTGQDGHVVEYGWQAVKGRCLELNVTPVTEYYFGRAKDLFPCISESTTWVNDFIGKLKETYLEKICPDCKNKMADEGIVLRVESSNIEVYKLKSELFILGESKAKDAGTEDMEEEGCIIT